MVHHRIATTVLTAAGLWVVAQGQDYLTTGQVYDFEVGDVFQSVGGHFGGTPTPPGYYTDTIISVEWSNTLDTVTYIRKRWVYVPPMGIDLPPSLLASHLDTLVYTDLDDTAAIWLLSDACPPFVKSLDSDPDMCGRLRWTVLATGDTCEVDGTYLYKKYVYEGCGGIFNEGLNTDNASFLYYHLTYYHKGDEICGSFQSIPVGLSETSTDLGIYAVLDPASEQMTIASAVAVKNLRIYDLRGSLIIYQENNPVIDLHRSSPGVHVLRGTLINGAPFTLRVIIP